MAEYREPGQISRDAKVVKFQMQPKENPRLQDDVLDRMGSGVLPKVVQHLFATHSVRLLGVAQSATFFMETSTDNWKEVLKHPDRIQDVLKQVFSQEVQQLVQWEDVYELDTNFTNFRLGGCPPKTLRDDDFGIQVSPALEDMASRYRQLQSEDCKAVRNEGTRIILVGKTGSGKSSLGNILLKREDREPPQDGEETASPSSSTDTVDKGFVVSHSLSSQTKTCEYKTSTSAWGRYLKVVDTPGLFDTEDSLAVTLIVLTNVLSLSLPGPHAVLFLIRVDVKFTQEENDAFKLILKMFEEEKVKKHLILVFTRGSDKIRCPIEQFLSDAPATLKEILDLVGDNYAVISKTSDKNVREQQVRHLLEKIDKVSNNGRDYYVNKDMEKMNTVMAEEIEKVMKERQMTYQQAEFAVKNGLAHDDKKFWTLKKKLILFVVASVAFAVLGGVAGATFADFAVGADITEAVVGAGVPMATTILSAVGIGIKEYAKTRIEKCVIL